MARTSRGYTSYRGRTPFWKVLLMAVLIVIILASGGVILLQRSLTFDGWGIARLPENSGGAQENVPELDIVSDGGDETAGSTDSGAPSDPEPEPVPETAAEPEEVPDHPNWTRLLGYRIQATPITMAVRHDAAAILRSGGENAAAGTLKDEDGTLFFTPPSAANLDNNYSTAADTTEALQSLAAFVLADGSTLHSIARIACFHDSWRSQMNVDRYGLKNTGTYIFYDGNLTNWLDPGKAAAREFLCGLAVDAAQLGFKEILLTAVGYPTEGKLDKIAYGSTPIGENLTQFLSEMRSALDPYGVKLSIELPKSMLIGNGDASGMTLDIAAPWVDRVYSSVMLSEIDACAEAVSAARADGSLEFVPELRGALPTPNPARYLLTT